MLYKYGININKFQQKHLKTIATNVLSCLIYTDYFIC